MTPQQPTSRVREPTALIHSAPVWLPHTQNWMYQQAAHLPSWLHNHVVCEWTQNLGEFALGQIHCLADAPRPEQLWDKALRRLGVRHHLGHLPEVAQQCGARILHSHFGNIGWSNLAVARKLGLRHVVTFYGQDVCMFPRQDRRWRDRYRALFAHVDLVLCEGSHMASRVAALGCPKSALRVHHLGIDIESIPFRPRSWDQKSPLRVLMAATFTEKKGIRVALRALAQVAESLPLEITLVGDSNGNARNEREKQRILATIDGLGFSQKIRQLGYQSPASLSREAYDHHLFLSPSITASTGDTEGGAPVCIIEMAASGMPVVSSRHCDIPEVIEHGVGGLLADEGDAEGLAAHLLYLAEHPDEWEAIALAARRRIERHYEVRKQSEALARLYAALL